VFLLPLNLKIIFESSQIAVLENMDIRFHTNLWTLPIFHFNFHSNSEADKIVCNKNLNGKIK